MSQMYEFTFKSNGGVTTTVYALLLAEAEAEVARVLGVEEEFNLVKVTPAVKAPYVTG